MKTQTHRYLQFTKSDVFIPVFRRSDEYGSRTRIMNDDEWSQYVMKRLKQEGFDFRKPIFKASGSKGYDIVYGQEM